MNCILALLLLAGVPVSAANSTRIHVTVVDRPITPPAIEQNGSLLLPTRGTFEALNSTVMYAPVRRMVSAQNIFHHAELRINKRFAIVDRRIVTLDAAPRLIDGTVYVPLRFAAQAMGANRPAPCAYSR